MDTWIERTCRLRCAVRALMLGLATLGLGSCTALIVNVSMDTLTGPHPIDEKALARASRTESLPHEFVVFECHDAVDTGVKDVRTTSKYGKETGRTETPYWAVPAGDRTLLVKSATKPAGRVAGDLHDVKADLAECFEGEDGSRLLRVYLDAGEQRIGPWIAIVLFGAGTAWFGFLCVRSARCAISPLRHPAVARIAATGRLPTDSAQVELELDTPDVKRFRRWAFTQHFVVDRRWSHFDVRRWTELLWAYPAVTRHTMYFVIPTGKTTDLVLSFDDGTQVKLTQTTTFGSGDAEVQDMLALVAERAPWVVIGFDDRTRWAWENDRESLRRAAAEFRSARRVADARPSH